MMMAECDECDFMDIRRPKTACPMCDDGTMRTAECER